MSRKKSESAGQGSPEESAAQRQKRRSARAAAIAALGERGNKSTPELLAEHKAVCALDDQLRVRVARLNAVLRTLTQLGEYSKD